MAQFFEVPAAEIEKFLSSKSFVRGIQGNEVVYTRKSRRNPDVLMKVYTSIRVGRTAVRSSGKDSIKVCVVFDSGRRSFGIGKFPPVFRVTSTESTLERLQHRIMMAAHRAEEWLNTNGPDRAPVEARPRYTPPAVTPNDVEPDDFHEYCEEEPSDNWDDDCERDAAIYEDGEGDSGLPQNGQKVA